MNSDRSKLPVTAHHDFDIFFAEESSLGALDKAKLAALAKTRQVPAQYRRHLKTQSDTNFIPAHKTDITGEKFIEEIPRRAVEFNTETNTTLNAVKSKSTKESIEKALTDDLARSGFTQDNIKQLSQHYIQLFAFLSDFLQQSVGDEISISGSNHQQSTYIYRKNGKTYASSTFWGMQQLDIDNNGAAVLKTIPGKVMGTFELTHEGFQLLNIYASNSFLRKLLSGERVPSLEHSSFQGLEEECQRLSIKLQMLINQGNLSPKYKKALKKIQNNINNPTVNKRNAKEKNQLILDAYVIIEAITAPDYQPSINRLIERMEHHLKLSSSSKMATILKNREYYYKKCPALFSATENHAEYNVRTGYEPPKITLDAALEIITETNAEEAQAYTQMINRNLAAVTTMRLYSELYRSEQTEFTQKFYAIEENQVKDLTSKISELCELMEQHPEEREKIEKTALDQLPTPEHRKKIVNETSRLLSCRAEKTEKITRIYNDAHTDHILIAPKVISTFNSLSDKLANGDSVHETVKHIAKTALEIIFEDAHFLFTEEDYSQAFSQIDDQFTYMDRALQLPTAYTLFLNNKYADGNKFIHQVNDQILKTMERYLKQLKESMKDKIEHKDDASINYINIARENLALAIDEINKTITKEQDTINGIEGSLFEAKMLKSSDIKHDLSNDLETYAKNLSFNTIYQVLNHISMCNGTLNWSNVQLNSRLLKILTNKISQAAIEDGGHEQEHIDHLIQSLSTENFAIDLNSPEQLQDKINFINALIKKASKTVVNNILRNLDGYKLLTDSNGKLSPEIATELLEAIHKYQLNTLKNAKKYPALSKIISLVAYGTAVHDNSQGSLSTSEHHYHVIQSVLSNSDDIASNTQDSYPETSTVSFQLQQQADSIPGWTELDKQQLKTVKECLELFLKQNQENSFTGRKHKYSTLNQFNQLLNNIEIEGLSKSTLVNIGRGAQAKAGNNYRRFNPTLNKIYLSLAKLVEIENKTNLYEIHHIISTACSGVASAVLDLAISDDETLDSYLQRAKIISQERNLSFDNNASLSESDSLISHLKDAKKVIDDARKTKSKTNLGIPEIINQRLQFLIDNQKSVSTESFNAFGKLQINKAELEKYQINLAESDCHTKYINICYELVKHLLAQDDLLHSGNAEELVPFVCQQVLSMQNQDALYKLPEKFLKAISQSLTRQIKNEDKLSTLNETYGEVLNVIDQSQEIESKQDYLAFLNLIAQQEIFKSHKVNDEKRLKKLISFVINNPSSDNISLLANALNILGKTPEARIEIDSTQLSGFINIAKGYLQGNTSIQEVLLNYFTESDLRFKEGLSFFYQDESCQSFTNLLIEKRVEILGSEPTQPTEAIDRKAKLYFKVILKETIKKQFKDNRRDLSSPQSWRDVKESERNQLSALRILENSNQLTNLTEIKNILKYLNSTLQISLPEDLRAIDGEVVQVPYQFTESSFETKEADIIKFTEHQQHDQLLRASDELLIDAEGNHEPGIEIHAPALPLSNLTEQQIIDYISSKISLNSPTEAEKAVRKILDNRSFTLREKLRLIGDIAYHKTHQAPDSAYSLYKNLADFRLLALGEGSKEKINHLSQLLTDFIKQYPDDLDASIDNIDRFLAQKKLISNEIHQFQRLGQAPLAHTGFNTATTSLKDLLKIDVDSLYKQQDHVINDNDAFIGIIAARVAYLKNANTAISAESIEAIAELKILPSQIEIEHDRDCNFQETVRLIFEAYDNSPNAQELTHTERLAVAKVVSTIFANVNAPDNQAQQVALAGRLSLLSDLPVDLAYETANKIQAVQSFKQQVQNKCAELLQNEILTKESLIEFISAIKAIDPNMTLIDISHQLQYCMNPGSKFNDIIYNYYIATARSIFNYLADNSEKNIEHALNELGLDKKGDIENHCTKYIAASSSLANTEIAVAFECFNEKPSLQETFIDKFITENSDNLKRLYLLYKAIPEDKITQREKVSQAMNTSHRADFEKLAEELKQFNNKHLLSFQNKSSFFRSSSPTTGMSNIISFIDDKNHSVAQIIERIKEVSSSRQVQNTMGSRNPLTISANKELYSFMEQIEQSASIKTSTVNDLTTSLHSLHNRPQ